MSPHPAPIAAAVAELDADMARLGITVETHPAGVMPGGRWGSYSHDTRTVHLLETLAPLQARSTLVHELAHAEHQHVGQCPEQEQEAEHTAARAPIGSPDHLTRVAMGLNLAGALAIGLGVLPRDVRAYLDADPTAAGAALLEAFRHSAGLTVPRPTEYLRNNPPNPAQMEIAA